ncbi:MAG: TetR/AcrR family transcriptional regulator [Micrococcus sp.]|nr:TetR/AcrR family transcriptional regulator [Micrococcus sp.]
MVLKGTEAMAAPDEAARRARSDARTRQLLEAAARLMERSGSHGVSMQAVADEAGVSVGLIYRYFANKQELVQGVILGVLDDMARLIPAAVEPEEDPVRRMVAAFSAYCQVVDDNREAVLLTYRESNTLDEEGRRLIKDLEVKTAQPLGDAIQEALDQGLLVPLDARVLAYDLLLIAHSWALKHWYFAPLMDFADFVEHQAALMLSMAVHPDHRSTYADLFGTPA